MYIFSRGLEVLLFTTILYEQEIFINLKTHQYKLAIDSFVISNILFTYVCVIVCVALKKRYTPPEATNGLSTSVNQQMRYFEPSIVADEFSCITKQVIKLFQSHDPKVLVEELEAIMASDKHDIKLLSDDQVEQLREHSNAQLLLQDINHLWSWSNHSMLRVLVGSCDEAIRLLDKFDCHLDPFEPIASYPVFEIMPTDPTTYTTLNVKAKKLPKITLQDVLDMCSVIVNKCGVTQHCLQLIATKNAHDTIIIYWSIPKCVMNLIISKVLQHNDSFYGMGMVEVEIYPDIHIATVNVTNLYVSLLHLYRALSVE